MISELVSEWEKNKGEIRKVWESRHPEHYTDIVTTIVSFLSRADLDGYKHLDTSRITLIDYGHCQGTLLYIIATDEYQTDDFYYVKVDYGSCSVCDTLESIMDESDSSTPTKSQVDQYMTLCLHIVQGIKRLGGESDK